jgi:hypothetical protein
MRDAIRDGVQCQTRSSRGRIDSSGGSNAPQPDFEADVVDMHS